MIERINFFERQSVSITYETLLKGIGGTVLLCLLWGGVSWWRQLRLQHSVQHLSSQIENLKQQRDRILNETRTGEGNQISRKVESLLTSTPTWSVLLKAINHALPSQVWLASIKSGEKEGSPSHKEILVNGQAIRAERIAGFVANLEESIYFEKVELLTSKEEAPGIFHFSLSCAISKLHE